VAQSVRPGGKSIDFEPQTGTKCGDNERGMYDGGRICLVAMCALQRLGGGRGIEGESALVQGDQCTPRGTLTLSRLGFAYGVM